MVLLARKDEEGNTQTLYDHLHGAGRLASGFEDEFADISRTAAVLHDVGKVAQQFQTYLLSDDGHRGDVQHARQGAFVVNDFFESKGEIEEIAKEILELAISKHHGGLPDCIDESGNRAFLLGFTESDKSNEKYAYQEIKRGLNGLALDLQSNFRGSAEDIACFLKKIKSLGMSKDSIYFYLGLLVKLIYSRLVDADRTDAACFETRKQYRPNTVDWQNLISRLDKSMRSFDSSSEINRIRHQINRNRWIAYLQRSQHKLGKDIFGEDLYTPTTNFPKKVVSSDANAKLLSANDSTNFTFRGRFSSKEQALLVDSASSQKINSTLRWLVNNHGTLTGNQAIVVWAIKRPEEKPVLNPQSGSFDFDDFFSPIADESKALHDDISDALNATNVQYAKIFSRVLRGYEGAEDLKKHNDPMVVVILDAATTGRLGVTFYCELKALSPMFLLGYSCQRRASKRKAQEISQKNNSNN